MIRQGWGRIINISGLAARQSGSVVGSIRNVSVAALSKNLADELGPHGINVTVVHPGLTRTERTADIVEELASREGISTEEAEGRMAQGISLRRPLKSSNTIENAIKSLRDHVPEWTEDRIISRDIELANSLIHQGRLAELLPAQPLDTILY